MSVLGKREILNLIRKKEIIIEPFREEFLKGNLLDLHIGNEYRKQIKTELRWDPSSFSLDQIMVVEAIPLKDKFSVPTGEFVIVETMETIALPDWIMAQIVGRISLSVLGILTQGGILHAGSKGKRMVMISNYGNFNISFQKGDIIAQLMFLEVKGGEKIDYPVIEDLKGKEFRIH